MFEIRSFSISKDTDLPADNQDACDAHAEHGVAAVADGVSTQLFSRSWAQTLVQSIVVNAPNPAVPESLCNWLTECRQNWRSQVDLSNLDCFQREKMKQWGAGASTLLWVQLNNYHAAIEQPTMSLDQPDTYGLSAFAIGDCCLFHVRDDQLVRSFPIEHPDEFGKNPMAINCFDRQRDHLLKFELMRFCCEPGDTLALCTDALAELILKSALDGDFAGWKDFWQMSRVEWTDWVMGCRERGELETDDTTLLLIGIPAPSHAPERSSRIQTQPVSSESGHDHEGEVCEEAGEAAIAELGATRDGVSETVASNDSETNGECSAKARSS